MHRVKIMLIQRDDLSEQEIEALHKLYPKDTQYEIIRVDPVNSEDHLNSCRYLQPDLVIIPEPLLDQAIQQGFSHVTLTADGLQKVHEFVPRLAPLTVV